MCDKRIVLLGGEGLTTDIVFNAINDRFGIIAAIIEDKEDKKEFIKRRINKLGLFAVSGQILFQLFISKPLRRLSKYRIDQIIKENSLKTISIPDEKIKRVKSVNSDTAIELLTQINPDLIIVNGTRIISKNVIASVGCKFINTHVGITPQYRGVHGAYWALINNDIDNCGVTVHFVDGGIDTGNIIYQHTIVPAKDDNIVTYPFLQLAAGVKLLRNAIETYFENAIVVQNKSNKSRLWYHPTIWQYIYNRIIKKVK
ncbi:MAG: formyl transferase [Helicobacteraceae bacterium]|nr:formyl transferase [Helicobacteraceae bacterium]